MPFFGYYDRHVTRATRRGQPFVGRVMVMVTRTAKLDRLTRVAEKPTARVGNSAAAIGDPLPEPLPGWQEPLSRLLSAALAPGTYSATEPIPLG